MKIFEFINKSRIRKNIKRKFINIPAFYFLFEKIRLFFKDFIKEFFRYIFYLIILALISDKFIPDFFSI